MIKTKHMERRTAAGFKGPLDDTLWLDVIAAYQKQLRKSREEYAAIGERGADAMPQIDFEIAFCARFLPKAASDDEVRAIVRETVARLGVSDPKQAGRVVGEIMKAQQGQARAGGRQADRRRRAGNAGRGLGADSPPSPSAASCSMCAVRSAGSGLSTVTGVRVVRVRERQPVRVQRVARQPVERGEQLGRSRPHRRRA